MKEKLGKQFVDIVGTKTYLYTLVATPDGQLFNLMGSFNRLLFFSHLEEKTMEDYLKNLREISVD